MTLTPSVEYLANTATLNSMAVVCTFSLAPIFIFLPIDDYRLSIMAVCKYLIGDGHWSSLFTPTGSGCIFWKRWRMFFYNNSCNFSVRMQLQVFGHSPVPEVSFVWL